MTATAACGLSLAATPVLQAQGLIISELLYNPPGTATEFVEIYNPTAQAVSLNSYQVGVGITFTFPASGISIAPSERIVVCATNAAAFRTEYGLAGTVQVFGPFGGRLANGSEEVTLINSSGTTFFSVLYEDAGDWPTRPDGAGSSLELKTVTDDFNDGNNWRASAEYLGTPGSAGTGSLLSIVVNEVLPHTDPPLEDAIELYNPTTNTIDISGWYLSDGSDNLKKYRIPNGTVMAPNTYRVYYQRDISYENTLVPFSLDAAYGDEVWLTSANASGKLLRFVDIVKFGASQNSISFGRYPNGTGPLMTLAERTFGTSVSMADPPSRLTLFRTGTGAANSLPQVGPVVISRLQYDPPAGGDEFIELRSLRDFDYPLFDPNAATNTWKFDGGVTYTFPQNVFIPVGQPIFLVATNPTFFRAKYQIPADIQIFGPYTGSLNNAGETLDLYKPDPPQEDVGEEIGYVPYILAESLEYDDESPWPTEPRDFGAPIQRITLTTYANTSTNWRADTTDTDTDTMPDWWERFYLFDPNAKGDAVTDRDSDGLRNAGEYIAGTHPGLPDSTLELLSVTKTGVNWRLSFAGVAGRAYTIEATEGFSPTNWVPATNVTARATNGLVTVDVAAPTTTRFYRVRATKAN